MQVYQVIGHDGKRMVRDRLPYCLFIGHSIREGYGRGERADRAELTRIAGERLRDHPGLPTVIELEWVPTDPDGLRRWTDDVLYMVQLVRSLNPGQPVGVYQAPRIGRREMAGEVDLLERSASIMEDGGLFAAIDWMVPQCYQDKPNNWRSWLPGYMALCMDIASRNRCQVVPIIWHQGLADGHPVIPANLLADQCRWLREAGIRRAIWWHELQFAERDAMLTIRAGLTELEA